MHDPRDLRDLVGDELRTLRELGYDVDALAPRAARALARASGPDDPALEALLRELEQAPMRTDGPAANEPMDAVASLATLAPARSPGDIDVGPGFAERVRGAWLGRCAGCMVGKPIEGWSAVEIRSYLEAAGAWPLDDYFPCVDPMPDGSPPMKPSWPRATRGRISGTARDDDIDYTVLGLLLLEEHGLEFTEEQVADALLARLPFGQVYTAERAAYRNLVDGIQPPRSATHRNPYREWIGALIRADIYGYVSPGDPRGAASLAARDASVTHAGAGIHAAMWAAALLAECLVRDAPRAVAASLDHVPPGSRLRRVLGDVVGWRAAGEPWEAVSGRLTDRFAGMSWVHALNNAALVAAALLWGDGDFGVSVGLAASAGWDADSAAATVGSAFGALHGARAIPDRFVHPLENRVESAVFGVGSSSIAGLADRTVHVARQAHLARSIAVPA